MELEKRIIEIIRSNINFQGEINLDTKLNDDIDSFDNLMIVNAIEDEFSITIKEEDLSDIKTIKDIVELVRKNKK